MKPTSNKGLIKGFLPLLTLVLLIPGMLKAQKVNDSLLIMNGVVLTRDSLLPVPNTHIISKFNRWGTISNNEGRFRLEVSPYDSVLFTTIGLKPVIVYVNDSVQKELDHFRVLMATDTVMINEIIIRAFYDYRTFKQMIVEMKPLDLDQFYPDWEGTELLYKQPTPSGLPLHPIQALYNWLNKSARLQRKLVKNRKEYNKLMIQMGRPQDTIPAIPEYMQGSQH